MSSWSIPIAQLVGDCEKDLDRRAREAMFGIFTAIVDNSPVDRGTFRNNWQIGFDQWPSGVRAVSGTKESPALASGDAQQALSAPRGITYFVNNLPYAVPLEYGHSEQAPVGMVRLAIREFKAHQRQQGFL